MMQILIGTFIAFTLITAAWVIPLWWAHRPVARQRRFQFLAPGGRWQSIDFNDLQEGMIFRGQDPDGLPVVDMLGCMAWEVMAKPSAEEVTVRAILLSALEDISNGQG